MAKTSVSIEKLRTDDTRRNFYTAGESPNKFSPDGEIGKHFGFKIQRS